MARRSYRLTDKDREFLRGLDVKGLPVKQKKFLCVFHSKLLNVSQTCRAIGISRARYYQWLNEFDTFRKAVEDVKTATDDDVETINYQLIFVDRDRGAVRDYMRTKLKDRGYGEYIETKSSVTVKNRLSEMSEAQLLEEIKRIEERLQAKNK